MAMRLIRLLALAVRAPNQCRLMPPPQPCQFDRLEAGARIAGLADSLLAIHPAAAPRTGRQPAIAGDLAPIAEVFVKNLVDQRCGKCRAQSLEGQQESPALGHLRRGWCFCRSRRDDGRNYSRELDYACSVSGNGTPGR
jgi:hypothetical protein